MSPGAVNRAIKFNFDERKATAAASLLLQLAGGSMAYLQLIKLLYYADRNSLDQLGHPISGDRYVSMPHGPVLSRVYNLLKQVIFSAKPAAGPWGEHIEGAGRYAVKLRTEPDLGPLSEAEVEIIKRVFDTYRGKDRWQVRDKSHELPEWEDPGKSSREIPIDEILRVLGKGDDEIEDIRTRAREKAHFDSIFGK
jgi:uncharacterized phage-associated protein